MITVRPAVKNHPNNFLPAGGLGHLLSHRFRLATESRRQRLTLTVIDNLGVNKL
jgi:hypothetical protein